jgi:hypothetical protein
MIANWDGQNFKNHANYNIFLKIHFSFYFLCSWDMFKSWLLISNFILHKYLINWLNQLYVNHKSHVSQPTITKYHTKVFENLKILLCMLLFKSAWFTFKLDINHMSWLMFSFQFSTIVSLVKSDLTMNGNLFLELAKIK